MATDQRRLEELASAVLDGTAVDWAAAGAADAAAPLRFIHHLQTVAAVAEVHRTSAAAGGPERCWGHLRLLERIGSGSFGEVYRAWDTRLDREVALKLLPADAAPSFPRPSSVIHEGRLLARVRHPNIVTIYGAERLDGQIGLWMEFVRGKTLAQLIDEGRVFPPREVAAIGAALCDALSAVHAAGLLHRDVKASNVMVADEGHVMLMDFGTGKEAADTSGGDLAGTPLYLAPEVLAGGEASVRSDIYSVGVLLYVLLTRRYPVTADSLDGLKIAHARRREADEPRSSRGLPSRMSRALGRALAPRPDRRHESADALRRALLSATRGGRTHAVAWVTGTVLTAAVPLAFTVWDGAPRASTGRTSNAAARVAPSISARERLTATGDAVYAAMSPDGENVIIDIESGGRSSLWLHRAGTSQELVAPAPVRYSQVVFAPDGQSILYLRSNRDESGLQVYRQAVAPGARPLQVYKAADLQGSLAVAPDGQRIAVVRRSRQRDESLLVVVDLGDGSTHTLARRPYAEAFWSVAWSPDGRTIAAGTGNADGGGRDMRVVAVNTMDGSQHALSPEPWAFIGRIAWLGDSGVMLVGTRELPRSDQIWFIHRESGRASRMTDDNDRYRGISLDASGDALVTGQVRGRRTIWVAPASTSSEGRLTVDSEAAKEISSGRGRISWTPDGDLVFSSLASGTPNIWQMAADGTRLRQLTRLGANYDPVTSPDGKAIVFESNRGDGLHLWRMDADGGNAVQLTSGPGEGSARITPDGQWVIYSTTVNRGLWQVPLAGGAPELVTRTPALGSAISPDGRWIAYNTDNDPTQSNPWQITIVPRNGGLPRMIFNRPRTEVRTHELHWTPDGTAITYEAIHDGISNLWIKPLNGEPPRRITNFTADQIYAFAWSPDGSRIAVLRGGNETDIVRYSLSR